MAADLFAVAVASAVSEAATVVVAGGVVAAVVVEVAVAAVEDDVVVSGESSVAFAVGDQMSELEKLPCLGRELVRLCFVAAAVVVGLAVGGAVVVAEFE